MKGRVLLSPFAIAGIAAAQAFCLALPHAASAQNNPTITNAIPASEAVNLQARITAIDPANRWVTLAGASGQQTTVVAGPNVRLELLKVGDRMNAQYYRSVGFAVNGPPGGNGVPVSNDKIVELLAQPVTAPGGVRVRLTKISGTVVGIDMSAHSLDVVNPSGGGVYTIDVTDPSRIPLLQSLKVGDTVTAEVSQALAVSITPAPKSWF